MRTRILIRIALGALLALAAVGLALPQALSGARHRSLDDRLRDRLHEVGFTGQVESTLTTRLGRPLDRRLADIGRMLWFDTITGLNDDNTCAGCHSPTAGFGDTQSIAIGIENNGIVGSNRTGPRNERRAPMVINTAFFPALMWNGRFASLSNDPFDNAAGFLFPDPEGRSLSYLPTLLAAQAFIPPTERTEVAGFSFAGDNDAIRAEVIRRLNATAAYRRLFGRVFPEVEHGEPIAYEMFAAAIAEFEFTLTFATAPIDRYAAGDERALSATEKRGAMLFFGQANCVQCHSVSGSSNEMFTDFKEHAIAVPQLVPRLTNNIFDGPAADQDFGRENVTGDPADRYRFRTPSLRNVALQPAFMHDGAFTNLADTIRFHLDVAREARAYDPVREGVDPDLAGPIGPLEPLLARLDPALATPTDLTDRQFADLLAFVRDGLLDPRAKPGNLRKLVPAALPSGRPSLTFEFSSENPAHG